MLKYLFMMLFMTPLFFVNWNFMQMVYFMMSFLFMMELGHFQYLEGLSNSMGLDLMSYTLILLSIWICMLMLLASEYISSSNFFKKEFSFVLVGLLFFLVLSFCTTNLFMFYLFFESSLIPTYVMILGWGYQSERIQAGLYLLLYTLISSLPLLLMLFYLYNETNMLIMVNYEVSLSSFNWVMFLFTYLAFLVKLPMFLLHLWLPKAHVEAPVAGSMILAGVLLKLGGYGILRVSKFLYKYILSYSPIFIILSLIGGVLISLNCLRQSDLKLLIAYSSVSHMGIMLGGLFTFSWWGMSSSLTMMLSHGLCSSGLFYLANVCFERVGSRSMLLVKGMIHYLPKMACWWFLFCAMNMAAPPSLNLLSEIGLINGLVSWSSISMVALGLMSFLAAGYSLYLFSFSQHGKPSSGVYSFYINNSREYLVLFLHWVPLNFLILNSEIVMNWI
uniref:NADH-ubiquinone oxidoreductase chain 4 n=1 Tax=Kilauella sp. KispEL TaxID=1940902 RepID=A0A8K1ZFR8_9NEOP|nr:NADH dehydrogenase subunit 4 [Kilauella sp. KispEL]